MNLEFFSGGAGCGKTFQLMAKLTDSLNEIPLLDGQKVLALTFMHGSRRRLDERLASVKPLARRFDCIVLDSFALRIVKRWRSLLSALGVPQPGPQEYEKICDAAAMLLAHDFVAEWVARTYPLIILDEAQDLDESRLRIIQCLAAKVRMLVAADEFQCLVAELRPNPAVQWLESVSMGTVLTRPRRTSVPELLDAATAVRAGRAPVSNGAFRIFPTSNAGLAGSFLANAIGWSQGRHVALITTSIAGKFAHNVVTWVSERTTGKGNGPYEITWERSEEKAASELVTSLALLKEMSAPEVLDAVRTAGDFRLTDDVLRWLETQRRTKDLITFRKEEIIKAIEWSFNMRKHSRIVSPNKRIATTVHGAKNREFDEVVLLWPGNTQGNADQKRRLLYNAITRAKRKCIVLVQVEAALALPPFA